MPLAATSAMPMLPTGLASTVAAPAAADAGAEAGATEAGATEAGATEAGAAEAGATDAGAWDATDGEEPELLQPATSANDEQWREREGPETHR